MLSKEQRELVVAALDTLAASLVNLQRVLKAVAPDLVDDAPRPPWFDKLFRADGKPPETGV